MIATIFGAHAQNQETDQTSVTVEDGYAAYDAGDYEKAREIMESLAASGNARAMNGIGIFHSEGKIFPKNRKIACDWYEKAIVSSYLPAQYNLSNCFGEMGGRTRDLQKQLYWLEIAANNKSKSAQLKLMTHFIHDDKAKAIYWAKEAAAQGSTAARVSLWQLDQDQEIEPVSLGEIACVWILIDILDKPASNCD